MIIGWICFQFLSAENHCVLNLFHFRETMKSQPFTGIGGATANTGLDENKEDISVPVTDHDIPGKKETLLTPKSS